MIKNELRKHLERLKRQITQNQSGSPFTGVKSLNNVLERKKYHDPLNYTYLP